MPNDSTDLNGRIFAAIVGSFVGIAAARTTNAVSLPVAMAAGAVLGTVALPKLFPEAYAVGEIEADDEDPVHVRKC